MNEATQERIADALENMLARMDIIIDEMRKAEARRVESGGTQ